jgi:hypothetical protein
MACADKNLATKVSREEPLIFNVSGMWFEISGGSKSSGREKMGFKGVSGFGRVGESTVMW